MASGDRRKAMFIDDRTKTIIFTDFKEEHAHLNDAYWIPALGYTISSDNFDGHVYISGATGSGKSYIIRKMIENDALKRKVILFTDLDKDDPSLESLNMTKFDPRTEYNWEWLEQNQHEKILVFDDVQFNEQIIKYRDTIIEKGRHMSTVVICVNHRLQDYQKTKVPLNDSRFVITFPSSNRGNVRRYLEYEFGLDKNDVNAIVSLAVKEGRHLIVHKFHPVTIATTESIIRV